MRGVIITLDDDKRIRRALQVAHGIDFYRYEVKFTCFRRLKSEGRVDGYLLLGQAVLLMPVCRSQ